MLAEQPVKSGVTFIWWVTNPSKYNLEERNMYNYIKQTRKQMNHGLLRSDRIEEFEKLMALMEQYKRKN